MALKEDNSTKEGNKCKLLLDLVKTSKENLKEEEESAKKSLEIGEISSFRNECQNIKMDGKIQELFL